VRLAAFGEVDVLEGALHAHDRAGVVAYRLAERANPQAPAGRGDDLQLLVERLARLEAGAEDGRDAFPVLGDAEADPLLDRGRVAGRHAVHLGDRVRPAYDPGPGVNRPPAEARGTTGDRQQMGLLAPLVLGALERRDVGDRHAGQLLLRPVARDREVVDQQLAPAVLRGVARGLEALLLAGEAALERRQDLAREEIRVEQVVQRAPLDLAALEGVGVRVCLGHHDVAVLGVDHAEQVAARFEQAPVLLVAAVGPALFRDVLDGAGEGDELAGRVALGAGELVHDSFGAVGALQPEGRVVRALTRQGRVLHRPQALAVAGMDEREEALQ
jgi:hypothetical protein